MGGNEVGLQHLARGLCLLACFVAICLVHCEAVKTSWEEPVQRSYSAVKLSRKYLFDKFDTYMPMDSSNTDPYVSSPFSLPPFESLAPYPLPENTPPYCIYPPFTPQPPSTIIPSPTGGGGSTPTSPPASSVPTLPGPTTPVPPIINPNPPMGGPSPTTPIISSPPYYEPSPPSFTPNNPPYYNIPSPSSGSIPSPRFLPPVVFPPPAVPPPPRRAPAMAQWCVAKAAVPDPIIQEAMNYACASGADCDQIQPSGSCFRPDTLFAHASYAFNSYWQRTRVTGGTCDFGGTAILVTVDPSYDGCHFING